MARKTMQSRKDKAITKAVEAVKEEVTGLSDILKQMKSMQKELQDMQKDKDKLQTKVDILQKKKDMIGKGYTEYGPSGWHSYKTGSEIGEQAQIYVDINTVCVPVSQ